MGTRMKLHAGVSVSTLVALTALAVFVGCATKKEAASLEEPEKTEEETPVEPESTTCEAKLDGDCGTCMKTECCEALTDCEGDPDCAACVSAEDSDACERTDETHARVDAYLTCKGGSCSDSCITVKAGSCKGLVDDIVPAKCAACLEKSCCDEVNACHGADVCWDGCFNNHDEEKCHADPDAHALYHAMGACLTEHCDAECN